MNVEKTRTVAKPEILKFGFQDFDICSKILTFAPTDDHGVEKPVENEFSLLISLVHLHDLVTCDLCDL